MTDLIQIKCIPCRGDEPTVTEAELAEYLPQVPQWQVVELSSSSFPSYLPTPTRTPFPSLIATPSGANVDLAAKAG